MLNINDYIVMGPFKPADEQDHGSKYCDILATGGNTIGRIIFFQDEHEKFFILERVETFIGDKTLSVDGNQVRQYKSLQEMAHAGVSLFDLMYGKTYNPLFPNKYLNTEMRIKTCLEYIKDHVDISIKQIRPTIRAYIFIVSMNIRFINDELEAGNGIHESSVQRIKSDTKAYVDILKFWDDNRLLNVDLLLYVEDLHKEMCDMLESCKAVDLEEELKYLQKRSALYAFSKSFIEEAKSIRALYEDGEESTSTKTTLEHMLENNQVCQNCLWPAYGLTQIDEDLKGRCPICNSEVTKDFLILGRTIEPKINLPEKKFTLDGVTFVFNFPEIFGYTDNIAIQEDGKYIGRITYTTGPILDAVLYTLTFYKGDRSYSTTIKKYPNQNYLQFFEEIINQIRKFVKEVQCR